jgi:hypothetical protein
MRESGTSGSVGALGGNALGDPTVAGRGTPSVRRGEVVVIQRNAEVTGTRVSWVDPQLCCALLVA